LNARFIASRRSSSLNGASLHGSPLAGIMHSLLRCTH
jgi:hypothetical protein